MNQLYKERMIEIYAEKKHFGILEGKNYEFCGKNPSCDDEIFIELKVENEKIIDARYRGRLCFVSTIAAEILMENIIGMKLENALNLDKKDIDKFLGMEITSTRAGCEVFPLDVLKNIRRIEN